MNYDLQPDQADQPSIDQNTKTIHTSIVEEHLTSRQPNRLLNDTAPLINNAEETLPRDMRRTLAQLRTDKSPLLIKYLNNIDPDNYPTDLCPLCSDETHDSNHLFNCTQLPTHLTTADLWADPVAVAGLVGTWRARLAAATTLHLLT